MDGDLMMRVFENLMNNAVRYSGEEKRIFLRAMLETDRPVLTVSIMNTGPGIQEKDLPLVFEPFHRGDASRNQKGFGLGLASVKAILDAHGWEIAASSDPGVETAFTIRIPVLPPTFLS